MKIKSLLFLLSIYMVSFSTQTVFVLSDSSASDTTKNNTSIIGKKISNAEIVIEGKIIKETNLYRKGGVFKRLLTIKVEYVYKGDVSNTIEVFSIYGYTEVCHLSYTIDAIGGMLENGDAGFFFLSSKYVNEQKVNGNDAYRKFLEGKYGFSSTTETQSAYLKKNELELDTAFLHVTDPSCKLKHTEEIRRILQN